MLKYWVKFEHLGCRAEITHLFSQERHWVYLVLARPPLLPASLTHLLGLLTVKLAEVVLIVHHNGKDAGGKWKQYRHKFERVTHKQESG